jgi:alcohol dehydrogenase class IV
MREFVYRTGPADVVFGKGTLSKLPDVIRNHGGKRALLLSTPEQSAQVEALGKSQGQLAAAYFHEATMHTPVEVTERAMQVVKAQDIDVVVAFGGGSTIGLGKAIALRTDIPLIAIPTTYAGSEMTPIIGQTENGRKTTQRSMKVLPRAVIYDVNLTLTLPPGLSGTSGINAIAHAAEGLYAQDTNPIMQLIAEEGIRALAQSLPVICQRPSDEDARAEALYGAWLCGFVLGTVGMALHHKLCHTLGGRFDLPHADTHTVILPHAIAYNAPAIPEAMVRLRRALKSDDPAQALFDLGRNVGAPSGLKDIGMPESGVPVAVKDAMENAYWNPRPLEADSLTAMLKRAWAGERPIT